MQGVHRLTAMLLVASLVTLGLALTGASALTVEEEFLHAGVSTDCGDGKTFTKLGPRWTSFPVGYSVSAPNADFAAAIERAFTTYEDIDHPTGQFFVSGGTQIEVSFAPIDGPLGILAQTQIWYNRITKAMVEVNIIFDSDESWAVFPTLACDSQGTGIDVEAVAAHELGHGVGLGHSSSSAALTMYPYYSLGATKQRTLATGDVKGVSFIYK